MRYDSFKTHRNMASLKEYINFIQSGKEYHHSLDINRRIEARFKYEIQRRDNFTCVKCGATEDLTCHHINPYSKFLKGRVRMDNGITLCHSCHQEFNRKYSVHQSLKELKEFLGVGRYYEIKDGYVDYNKELWVRIKFGEEAIESKSLSTC